MSLIGASQGRYAGDTGYASGWSNALGYIGNFGSMRRSWTPPPRERKFGYQEWRDSGSRIEGPLTDEQKLRLNKLGIYDRGNGVWAPDEGAMYRDDPYLEAWKIWRGQEMKKYREEITNYKKRSGPWSTGWSPAPRPMVGDMGGQTTNPDPNSWGMGRPMSGVMGPGTLIPGSGMEQYNLWGSWWRGQSRANMGPEKNRSSWG